MNKRPLIRFFGEFSSGILSYYRSLLIFDKHNLWKASVVPGLLSLFLFIAILVLSFYSTSRLVMHFHSALPEIATTDHPLFIHLFNYLILGVVTFFFLKLYRLLLFLAFTELWLNFSRKITLFIQAEPDSPTILFFNSSEIRLQVLKNFLLEILLIFITGIAVVMLSWLLPLVPVFILIIESYFSGRNLASFRPPHLAEVYRKTGKDSFGFETGIGLVYNVLLLVPLLGAYAAMYWALFATIYIFKLPKKGNYADQIGQSILQ
jgi:hypothetical protein